MHPEPMSLDVARLRPPDRPGMLRLFTEPQFSYKSFIPDLLDEGEIDALVGAGTLVCWRQDDVVGLIELEEYPAGYRGHFLMHARFATRVPAALAAATVDAGRFAASPIRSAPSTSRASTSRTGQGSAPKGRWTRWWASEGSDSASGTLPEGSRIRPGR